MLKFFSHYLGIKKFDHEITSDFVFVVGCSHSGTTLLATILGRHRDILPIGEETYIFGQSSFFAKSAIYQWDILCRQYGKKIFLEKTPKHVYELDKIFRLLPSSKILFIVRNPVDNIASLVRRNNDLRFSIKKWIRDNRNLFKCKDDDRLLICYYENLVTDPVTEVKRISRFLGLEYDEKMITDNKSAFFSWKESGKTINELRYKQVTKPITDNTGKGYKYFSKDEVNLIHQITGEVAQRLEIPVTEKKPG